MAIYHLSAKVISRGTGRSSVAAAAYRSAERLRDVRQGLEHDYTRKGGVVHAEIITPADAPLWMRDRRQLWNAVEAVEKRRDAQLAREIEISLPRELDGEQRISLLRAFIQREFIAHGMIADLVIHETKARDGKDQPHAHIMLTMRELTGNGFGKKARSWNGTDFLLRWREAWANEVNTALERVGCSERIDHRSLTEQCAYAAYQAQRARSDGRDKLAIDHEQRVIDLSHEPEPKIGPTANAMEKRGIETERGDLFRGAQARNEQRKELGLRQPALRLELIKYGYTFIAAASERLDKIWRRAQAVISRIKERFSDLTKSPKQDDGYHSPIDRKADVLGHNIRCKHEITLNADNTTEISMQSRSDRINAILGRSQNKNTGCRHHVSHELER